MTDAIEKLADIIYSGVIGSINGDVELMSEEILAAIQADPFAYLEVKPLVWAGVTAEISNGCYYTSIPSQTGKSWCVCFVYRGGSHTLGHFKSEELAQAAAQTHHDNRLKECFR